ncbi:hypothetical protein DPEC_G00377630, partial [Dallia pectoralis]
VFTDKLSDHTTPEFKALEATIVFEFDIIYKTKYGSIFIRTIVIAFRSVSTTRSLDTQAEVQLVFNDTQPVPPPTEIGDTLRTFLNTTNGTLGNITVVQNTINVTVITGIATGNATTNTTAPPVITFPIDTTTTSASTPTATTTSTTTTTATTTSTTASVPLSTVVVVFKSVGETFTSDLSDSSTQGFKNRALLIKTQLEPFYQKAFTSFISLNVTKFSSGSIINNLDVVFPASSVPSGTAILKVLIDASQNITAFNIDPASITITTIANSGVRSQAGLVTASCLVVFSLLLSRQH